MFFPTYIYIYIVQFPRGPKNRRMGYSLEVKTAEEKQK